MVQLIFVVYLQMQNIGKQKSKSRGLYDEMQYSQDISKHLENVVKKQIIKYTCNFKIQKDRNTLKDGALK